MEKSLLTKNLAKLVLENIKKTSYLLLCISSLLACEQPGFKSVYPDLYHLAEKNFFLSDYPPYELSLEGYDDDLNLEWAYYEPGVRAFPYSYQLKEIRYSADEAPDQNIPSYCDAFRPNLAQIRSFFLKALIVIESHELKDAHDFLPCYVEGTAMIEGREVKWLINAGKYARITDPALDVEYKRHYADHFYVACPECRWPFFD